MLNTIFDETTPAGVMRIFITEHERLKSASTSSIEGRLARPEEGWATIRFMFVYQNGMDARASDPDRGAAGAGTFRPTANTNTIGLSIQQARIEQRLSIKSWPRNAKSGLGS